MLQGNTNCDLHGHSINNSLRRRISPTVEPLKPLCFLRFNEELRSVFLHWETLQLKKCLSILSKNTWKQNKIPHFHHTPPQSVYWRAQHTSFCHLLCYFAGCTEGEDKLREITETLNRLSTPLTRPGAPVKPRWIGAEPVEVWGGGKSGVQVEPQERDQMAVEMLRVPWHVDKPSLP